nr:hypothetical protein [Paracoccus saliphilus]
MSGRAKATLLDAIRTGRLSAPKDAKGRYEIDPSELHRVFPFLSPNQSPTPSPEPVSTPIENHSNTKGLEREVELLREMLNTAEKNADHWRHMAERQQALLEDKRPRGLFKRFFGK